MSRKLLSLLGALFLAAALPGRAQAAVLLDFGTGGAGSGGTVTALGGGQYSGSGIPVDILSVTGAGATDGIYDLTGAFICPAGQCGPAGNAAVVDFNTTTSLFTITGGVAANAGTGTPAIGSQVLLNGLISTFSFSVNPTTNRFSFEADGNDTKSLELMRILGLPLTTQWAFGGFTIGGNWNGTTGVPTSSDFLNTSVVPEPGSMVLLGSGLLGLAGMARRRWRGRSTRA